MAFDQFSSPNIPIAPKIYDQGYFNQLIRTIGGFFKLIDSRAGITVDSLTTNQLFTQIGTLTVSNGANNNIEVPPYTFLRITGPTASFDINGFNSSPQSRFDGRWIIIFNPSSNNMTIHNEEIASSPENRINTMTGGNINISGTGIATFVYSVQDLRWLVVGHQG